MLEGKALVEDTDMPVKMQIQAMAAASEALDLFDVVDCKSIAAHIKKVSTFSLFLSLSLMYFFSYETKVLCFLFLFLQEFDSRFGSGWQCVVGSSFGCFFTHSKGTFIYFTLETLNFLIFKGASFSSSSPPSSPH